MFIEEKTHNFAINALVFVLITFLTVFYIVILPSLRIRRRISSRFSSSLLIIYFNLCEYEFEFEVDDYYDNIWLYYPIDDEDEDEPNRFVYVFAC